MVELTRSPRERYREQVRDEVKAHAWSQVATTGASALSLNAIAKQMGISGPALYRYFRNRDDLITELVLDAYRDLADTCVAIAATEPDPRRRLDAVAAGLRRWALAAPHRYLLIYGTPVPGYAAPPEATVVAASIMRVLLDAFAALAPAAATTPAARAWEAHLADHRDWAPSVAGPVEPPRLADAASPAVLRRAMAFWTRLHGVVSLEVAGHFTGMGFDPAWLFGAEVASVIDA